jgi:hypothetical protein
MPEYILLMHDDLPIDANENSWGPYLESLRKSGSFEGGSEIGDGICVRKSGAPPEITAHLTGYIRLKADNIDHAKSLLSDNPHFEAGGTVEIRMLPHTK